MRYVSQRLLILVATTGLFAIPKTSGAQALRSAYQSSRECPHSWEEEEGRELRDMTSGTIDVPEFNDCQRFVLGSASEPAYSSNHFAIFAVHLDDLERRIATSPVQGERAAGIIAAVIFADESYEPLAIRPGLNCLLVNRSRTRSGDVWTAFIQEVYSVKQCEAGVQANESATQLPLVRTTRAGSSAQDAEHYPPVARWGFDVSGWQHYAILRCGSGTCYIGHRGTEPPAHPAAAIANANAKEMRVYRVAGWHDEQLLAVETRTTGGGGGSDLTPSDIWATVVPDPDLDNLDQDSDFDDWETVAEVFLSKDSPAYKDKFNFEGTSPATPNVIAVCNLAAGCVMPSGVTPPSCATQDAHHANASGGQWRARIRAPSGEEKYMCVRRWDAGAIGAAEVPATARWRWVADDETLWFRCAQGCCEVEGP